MKINNIRKFIKERAQEYGAKINWEKDRQEFERNNTSLEALKDDGGYFGFISPDEDPSGVFHDFSLTIFPSHPEDLNDAGKEKPWLVCLGIGSSGFKNDYEIASYPGLRRMFSKIVDEEGFCKTDFTDIETSLPKNFRDNPKISHFKKTLKKNNYDKVLPACQIVDDPDSEDGKKIISAFVAGYARLREWPTNKKHKKAISDVLNNFLVKETIDHKTEIKKLVLERRFVILQGPPGTGKTRAAKIVAEEIKAKTHFIQFHAETNYSDFVFGIRPELDTATLKYKGNLGTFTLALKEAIEKEEKGENVLLIVDEINRANLSNVLGPIFYLFEHKMTESNINIEIYPGFSINKIPKNLFVIATMNTADRSLAVVDFALRRRFAWFDMYPIKIEGQKTKIDVKRNIKGVEKELKIEVIEMSDNEYFFIEDFSEFQKIFDWYATSHELSLQPGQGYFIASSDDEMKNRVKYELHPLIKEYLEEGLMRNAKEEFNEYFSSRISQLLFK